MTARRPLALARTGMALAAAALPRAARARYRQEFLAELHDLPPVAQLRHTAAVLIRTPALRAALEEGAMPVLARRRPFWRCRVFRWHEFVVRSTEDGGRYQTCLRCGTDRGPVSHHPLTTPPYPVGSAGA